MACKLARMFRKIYGDIVKYSNGHIMYVMMENWIVDDDHIYLTLILLRKYVAKISSDFVCVLNLIEKYREK